MNWWTNQLITILIVTYVYIYIYVYTSRYIRTSRHRYIDISIYIHIYIYIHTGKPSVEPTSICSPLELHALADPSYMLKPIIFQSRIDERRASHMKFNDFSIKNELKNCLKVSRPDSYEIWWFFNQESIEEGPQKLQTGFI